MHAVEYLEIRISLLSVNRYFYLCACDKASVHCPTQQMAVTPSSSLGQAKRRAHQPRRTRGTAQCQQSRGHLKDIGIDGWPERSEPSCGSKQGRSAASLKHRAGMGKSPKEFLLFRKQPGRQNIPSCDPNSTTEDAEGRLSFDGPWRRGDPEPPLRPFISGSLRSARDDDPGSSKPRQALNRLPLLRLRGLHRGCGWRTALGLYEGGVVDDGLIGVGHGE
jgi:hypothetical protein